MAYYHGKSRCLCSWHRAVPWRQLCVLGQLTRPFWALVCSSMTSWLFCKMYCKQWCRRQKVAKRCVKMQRRKSIPSIWAWKEWNAGEPPNPLFLNVPYSLKQNPVLSYFFKGSLATESSRTHCPWKKGCPSGLKDCLAQETWALPSYHLLNPRIGCASIRILRHAYTGEIGCSELHHGSDIRRSPGPRDHKKQHLRGCSALSQFTQTSTLLDWPPLGQLDRTSDWGFGRVYGWYGWTDSLSDRTNWRAQPNGRLLIQTWLSWKVPLRSLGGLWSSAKDALLSCMWGYNFPSSLPPVSYSFFCCPPLLATWFWECQALAIFFKYK